jgi:hypothetical protein
MLVPQDSPCPNCGHPRRDHDIGRDPDGEKCAHCDCTIPIEYATFDWDPNEPPDPFNWTGALEFIVVFLDMIQVSFSDFIANARPGFKMTQEERDDLLALDAIVRNLWQKVVPQKPKPAGRENSDVQAENAAVDEYEAHKDVLKSALANLTTTDDWRTVFPEDLHGEIERARAILRRHGVS